MADRGTFLFSPAFQSEFFLNTYDVAVNVAGKWKFYDVASQNLPPGQLRWQEQGVYALISDPKDAQFVQTTLLSANDTKVERIGNLTLSPDGDLEGDVREIYSGNKAIDWRQRFGLSNVAEREESLRDELKHRFADFDLSNVHWGVTPDLTRPVGVNYHIVVRGYAQRTGKRLFVLPDYFQVGYGARFTDTVRTQGICFEYPWSEYDNITLQLPPGFQLDHPDAPGGVNFQPIGSFGVRISVTRTNQILYVKAYPTVKEIFDKIHEADNHVLTLKAGEQPAPGQ
jgi:hypothetical protein